jgi:hypothetical protein
MVHQVMEREEPSTPTETSTAQTSSLSTPHLSSTEPSPGFPRTSDAAAAATSNSVPSLRFPRPLGNRQLTNWVSSSSPDIMQPGTILDDEASLAELGYDIIGTDGESQAESTTSSTDYQRTDDIQSLTGTDTGTDVDTTGGDTDSSDDEDEVTQDDAVAHRSPSRSTTHSNIGSQDATDAETLVDRSLESPTSFDMYGIPNVHTSGNKPQAVEETRPQPPTPNLDFSSDDDDLGSADTEKLPQSPSVECKPTTASKVYLGTIGNFYEWISNSLKERRHVLILDATIVLVLVALSGAVLTNKYLSSPQTPRILSTVPVASVSPALVATTEVASLSTTAITTTSTAKQQNTALQTDSSAASLNFMPLGRGPAQLQKETKSLSPAQTICSAERANRNQLLIKIPRDIKASWLAKDAILIAVSRGAHDLQTQMTLVEEGFLIEIPLAEAHGVMDVSIATTRKPKVNESFQVNFGSHMLTGAFGVGKQLVKSLRQKVVDTVNETTLWVEEAYIPSLDVVSRQVCDQTVSISDSLQQRFREARRAAFQLPARFTSQVVDHIKQSVDGNTISQRATQAQLELSRTALDVRDELALGLLTAQLNSKLWWLKVRGKEEEHQRYLINAEAYYKKMSADAHEARRERAVNAAREIHDLKKQEDRKAHSPLWSKGNKAQ